ncbi:hypothetical protein HYV86_04300 [Candidatus Woesearchaeota archaeon]|nr:hypothetical protein [Candidatus Woesearchaeota archaeon]
MRDARIFITGDDKCFLQFGERYWPVTSSEHERLVDLYFHRFMLEGSFTDTFVTHQDVADLCGVQPFNGDYVINTVGRTSQPAQSLYDKGLVIARNTNRTNLVAPKSLIGRIWDYFG